MFGAGQRVSEPLTALAFLTGADGKKTRATKNAWRGARVDICNRPMIVYVWVKSLIHMVITIHVLPTEIKSTTK